MKTTGNTILITGGATGIGQALATRFLALGNQVIITGRRQAILDQAVAAHPGLHAMAADVADPDSVRKLAAKLTATFPTLNAVIHNAGIMQPENLLEHELTTAEATIATNLLGPIRLTAALLPHLLTRPDAAILTVSSGLAFMPLSLTPTYSATKAAIHSYSQSLRYQLRGKGVQVIEIAPPYVQTELMGPGQAADPRAMPLIDFADEVMSLLTSQPDAEEILVERVKFLRFAEVNGDYAKVFAHLNGAFH